jgi:hypothetical protein
VAVACRSAGKTGTLTVTHGINAEAMTCISTGPARRSRSLPSWSCRFDPGRPLRCCSPGQGHDHLIVDLRQDACLGARARCVPDPPPAFLRRACLSSLAMPAAIASSRSRVACAGGPRAGVPHALHPLPQARALSRRHRVAGVAGRESADLAG